MCSSGPDLGLADVPHPLIAFIGLRNRLYSIALRRTFPTPETNEVISRSCPPPFPPVAPPHESQIVSSVKSPPTDVCRDTASV